MISKNETMQEILKSIQEDIQKKNYKKYMEHQ